MKTTVPANDGRGSDRRPRAGLISALAAASLAILLIPPAAASDDTGVPFSERIDVRVVNVEVVVTDRNGLRIHGLEPEDFELRVDGEVREIDYFTEIRGGTAILPQEGRRSCGVPSIAPGQPVGTSYLLFIDDYFSLKRDRDQVLNQIQEQLSLLSDRDRMAVVAFDGILSSVEELSSLDRGRS